MLNAWLIYRGEDIPKNSGSIDIFRRSFEGIADLKVLEESRLKLSGEDNVYYVYDSHPIERPDIVINRTRNSDLTPVLQKICANVFNPQMISELGNDKLKALRFAEGIGIRTMPVYRSVSDVTSWPVVVKTVNGHGGSEVFLAKAPEEAQKIISGYGNVFLQEYSENGSSDMRVYVIGGKIYCAMLRESEDDFRSNYSLGGKAYPVDVPPAVEENVHRLADAIGETGYCGMDFIRCGDEWVFNEIEDVVGARMVYANTDLDPIGEFVKYILSSIR